MAQGTEDLTLPAKRFHALSDATRLGILTELASGECCVCDLTDALEAAQSRLSFHLRILKEAGLVTDRRDGRWVYYAIDRNALDGMSALIDELKKLKPVLKCC